MSDLSICGDRWHGVANDEWHVDAPSWDDVSRAIRRLDGRTYTLVTIGGSGEEHLAVGGGAGRYVVYVTRDNWDFWNLLSHEDAEGTVSLFIGGQDGDYPARRIVDLEQAEVAARAFLSGRRLEPTLRWEKQ
ncbi:MAG: Imm1 family immunity protein [Polyangiales bacterium]